MAERRIDPKFNIHKEYKRMFIMNPYRNGGGMNPLTEAFILSTGITNSAQIDALNTMEQGLIDNGLILKMKALYPFVGGTAHTHKFNFMDARDLDSAYRIGYVGTGGIHSSNGFNPDKIKHSLYIAPSDLPQNDAHISYYSRTNVTNSSAEISNSEGNFLLALKFSTIGAISRLNNLYSNNAFYIADRTDYYGIITRINSSTNTSYANGVKVSDISQTSSTPTTSMLYLGGIASNNSNKECAFASIGYGLTDVQALALDTIVQAYNTALGRAIAR